MYETKQYLKHPEQKDISDFHCTVPKKSEL